MNAVTENFMANHYSILFATPLVKQNSIAAVLDFHNLDALLAWGILAGTSNIKSENTLNYNRNMTERHFPDDCTACVVLGVELPLQHLELLAERYEQTVIYAYQGSYPDVHKYKKGKLLEKIKFVWPHANDTGLEQYAADNAVCKMLMLEYPALQEASWLSSYVEDVSRYINLMPLQRDSARPYEPVRRSKLHEVQKILSFAATANRTEVLTANRPLSNDTSDYVQYNRRMRSDIQRYMSRVVYGAGDARVMAPTMCVSSDKYHDCLVNVLMSESSFVGYFNEIYSRVWRVYSKHPNNMEVIRKYLKPTSTWMEGPVLCLETKLPEFNP